MTDKLLTVKAGRLMITMPDGTIIDPKIGEPYATMIADRYLADTALRTINFREEGEYGEGANMVVQRETNR